MSEHRLELDVVHRPADGGPARLGGMPDAPPFTFTRLDRLRSGLGRLSYGFVNWRGYDARRLAAESAAAGRTAIVVGCRFAPGFRGPSTTSEWRAVRVFVGNERSVFALGGRRRPVLVEVEAGRHPLRIEHDGPPPSFETTVDVPDGRTVLIEVRTEEHHLIRWLRRSPTVSIWVGDDHLQAEHAL